MIYNFIYESGVAAHPYLNVLKYISLRSMGALLTALFLSFLFGERLIAFLKKIQKKGQPIRNDGPASHLETKKGTPTMGGLLIIIATVLGTLLWSNLSVPYVWVTLGVMLLYAGIGFADDYLKVVLYNPKGLSGKMKLLFQIMGAAAAVYIAKRYMPEGVRDTVTVPFFKDIFLDFGMMFIPFAIVVIVGASNAVNLTDGLDGLAIGPIVFVSICLGIVAYVVGHSVFSTYLYIPHVPEVGELTVFCGALIGAGLGFLWYNAPPASVFMGDTGSLAIGGALGIVSILTKHAYILFITGGLFVAEAVSVMLQVGYFKYSGGRRIFLMAPLHHHYEQKGWSETKIVMRFWIISLVLALIGLATLKLR